MSGFARLGGFKIMKGVVGFSMVLSEASKSLPAILCRSIAAKKINLPYITCIRADRTWGLNIMVDAELGLRTSLVIQENFGETFIHSMESAILSIFPHRNNPDIMGRLFHALGSEGIPPDSLALSPSAISVVLKEGHINRAGMALFKPFTFSAFRTPEDWKLAQKGKEHLYKEVVASYQEQRPKVYGLEYYDKQSLLYIRFTEQDIINMGTVFKQFADLGINLTFSAAGPSWDETRKLVSVCLPDHKDDSYRDIINRELPHCEMDILSPVSIFSMNGPHFGDRYGISGELLTALEKNGVDLLCLSCTIASITGVVPSPHLESALLAIQGCFEVPNLIKK